MNQLIVMLQSEDIADARVTVGHRWMVWCWASESWEVYEKVPYQRGTKMILQTDSLDQAVNCLSKGEDI
jgi:hypothetical protein